MKSKNNHYYQLGYGGLGIFFFGAVIAVTMFFFIFPDKYRRNIAFDDDSGYQYCRDMVDKKDAPMFTNPAVIIDGEQIAPATTYRLIKKDVPIQFLPDISAYVGKPYSHWLLQFNRNYEDPQTKKKYIIRAPTGRTGRSYPFRSSLNPGLPVSLEFAPYGLLFLYHANDDWTPRLVSEYPPFQFNIADIYKAVDTPDLPDWVLQCLDDPPGVGTINEENGELIQKSPIITYEFFYPKQNWSPLKFEEQLGYFLPKIIKYVHPAWWTPHCKPAIYLYPEEKTNVNVKVSIPYGNFLYTDPLYPSNGWTVIAHSNGDIVYSGDLKDSKGIVNYPSGVFPYLYYEARIHDSAIEKPTEGFVVAYDNLPMFYADILPELGLNGKETQEFKHYWEKALPYSPFYFIGIIPPSNLDHIEPLTITPKQDTTIRVSLYFEALNTFRVVTPPSIKTPKRNGFTVVEWGGMIKTDKDHPFTCSQ